jgi:hypothetical protein
LRSDVRASVRPFALLEGDPYWWRSKGELLHCVQTGQPAPQHLYGTDEWEYLRQHPETAAVFNDAMTAMTQEETPAILDAYDFSPIHRLVDVGGGHGALLAALLRTYPGMHGILFDQPDVVSHALPLLQANGVSNRCETIGGDLFGEMPDCSDGYLLKLILHDWDDEHAAQILANLRRSMSRTARLLLVEHVIVPGNDPQPGKGLDLAMLAYVGGRERTAAEWEDLLQATGFTLTRIVPTQAALSILEAAPR